MASDVPVQLVGNLTADPELRFTPSGTAVASFTVAQTPTFYNRQTGKSEDRDPIFMRCSIWRQAAENVAASLHRGDRVLVVGRLRSRSFETSEGEKRTVIEVDVDAIGPELRWATAEVSKNPRHGNAQPTDSDDPWGPPADELADRRGERV